MRIQFFNFYVVLILLAFLVNLSGCGKKKSNNTAPIFSSPVNVGCNPATGINCPPGNNIQIFSQNSLYQFETDLEGARQLFEELPNPGSIAVGDVGQYYSPETGGFEFNFFFNGGCVLGCNRKDQVRFEVKSVNTEVVWMERSYPQKPNARKRNIDKRRQDIIDQIFDEGNGNAKAFKVCLSTSYGNLKGVMVVRFRQSFFGPQITRRTVGVYQIPLAFNPVYKETLNSGFNNKWKLDVLSGGKINGKPLTVNFENAGSPIASCNY